MLIHATITVTGEEGMLVACELRLRQALAAPWSKAEVTAHHGPRALCYDLKVEGGIPFPLFVEASQAFPQLAFSAEWVNIAAGERGSARIVNGRLIGQQTDRIAVSAAAEHPVYVAIEANGTLRLALTVLRAGRGEWRGYALTAARDALLRIVRAPQSAAFELYATEGSPEWVCVWRGTLQASFTRDDLQPPLAIEEPVFSELDALARDFVADWIWFAAAPEEEIAIEKERHARRRYTVSAANVRSEKLERASGGGAPCDYSTLAAEERWVKDLVLATWAKEETA